MAGQIFLPDAVRCPHCGADLLCEGASLGCTGERRHCYDIAREGYVNLLPPGRAKNSHTGDGADMVRARREFLELGLYDRYSAEAAALASRFVPVADNPVLVDAGCGEGRHTVNMVRTLRENLGRDVTGIGFDASKYAAAAAAKRYARKEDESFFFAAANIFQMPVKDSSAHIMTSLFAPLPEEEAGRILVPGGVLMICAAGPSHLSEMRDILYDTPIPSGGGAAMPAGFDTVAERVIEYTATLTTAEAVQSLFVMTPFYHNAPSEGRVRLEARDSLTVTVQVKCTVGVRR